jgi:hypothetical protein
MPYLSGIVFGHTTRPDPLEVKGLAVLAIGRVL